MCGRCGRRPSLRWATTCVRVLGNSGEHAYQLQRYLAGPLTEVQRFKFVCRAGVLLTARPAFSRAKLKRPSAHSARSARKRPCIMPCWRAQPLMLSGRRCGLRWSKRWGGRLSALRRLSRLTSSLRTAGGLLLG
jgi:hypothetical protein